MRVAELAKSCHHACHILLNNFLGAILRTEMSHEGLRDGCGLKDILCGFCLLRSRIVMIVNRVLMVSGLGCRGDTALASGLVLLDALPTPAHQCACMCLQ